MNLTAYRDVVRCRNCKDCRAFNLISNAGICKLFKLYTSVLPRVTLLHPPCFCDLPAIGWEDAFCSPNWLFMLDLLNIKVFVSIHRLLLKATIILLPVLGFTWIIGLFVVGDGGIVFAYLFVIANVFQVRRYFTYQWQCFRG